MGIIRITDKIVFRSSKALVCFVERKKYAFDSKRNLKGRCSKGKTIKSSCTKISKGKLKKKKTYINSHLKKKKKKNAITNKQIHTLNRQNVQWHVC